MSLTSLANRLEGLPLVLCGPILRRTDDLSVTVWVALRRARVVRLEVFEEKPGGGWGATILSAEANTVRVGEHLHILAITARGGKLSWGRRYGYNLDFAQFPGSATDTAGVGDLFVPATDNRSGVVARTFEDARAGLTYWPDGPDRPSFTLPPDAAALGGGHPLEGLRIFHGSCRKAHGEGEDALPILDDVIHASMQPEAADPRPHMLLLTGDQIYADDVADALLALLIDAGRTLLQWPVEAENETLPGPGFRSEFAKVIGLTAMFGPGGGTAAKSHLMRFSEFAAMYLFAWSDVLWPEPKAIPQLDEVFADLPPEGRKELAADFGTEVAQLVGYRAALPKVRRAMANTPVYMIFDDHEVTDDWNLTSGWEREVYQHENVGGRRHVLNGLLAYALFQGWGNTPEQFDRDKVAAPGARLLAAVNLWMGARDDHETAISACLNVPTYHGAKRAKGEDHANILRWHYDIQTPGFQCLVLDTRTMRGFPRGPDDPPDLLDRQGFERQIQNAPLPKVPADMTMVVATTNVVSEPLTEMIVELSGELRSVFSDTGDAWTGQSAATERLLVELANRNATGPEPLRRAHFAIATGDIHYGFAVRGQYWAPRGGYRPAGAKWPDGVPLEVVFAEFTASSFHNQASKTEMLHHFAFGAGFDEQNLKRLMSASWLGWRMPPKPSEIEIKAENPSLIEWLNPFPKLALAFTALRHRRISARAKLLSSRPALLQLDELPDGSVIRRPPDWIYRLDFMKDETPMLLEQVVQPATGADQARAEQAKSLAAAHRTYAEHGAGRIVVGRNNIGEIRFDWDEDDKAMVQRLWWRLKRGEPARPLTKYRVPFGFQIPAFPKPSYPGAQ
ncbi:alkaline phosphatase D family protein [Allosphingosinicella deserti]|uniref:PhoD-like phosphatase metallophosphatase domain-containing protein n=1 Tax=Allosphingosinicella deserti TaxID=2116704 RepID=A0A2P7QI79_9SPHN|nr:hypothetical protein [Sphingomonas deserti]PSJ37671.1 hypothetical protein C7I55_21655 [Sphingomonas deserti]